MPLAELLSWETAFAVAAIVASGLVRGFNGGQGANFLSAPVLSLLIGPREAVPLVLLLNLLTSVQLLPGTFAHARWDRIMPMGVAASLAVPLGAWILFVVDEELMRRVIAGMAAAFALLLLAGWRYRGARGPVMAAGVGATSGAIAGAVSMGGPPVILYLMSGPEDAAHNRANFIIFSTFVGVVAIATFVLAGAFTTRMLWLAAVLTGPYVLATWAGARLFLRASDTAFRRFTLGLLAGVSLAILVL